jgi:hypothetical protein
MTEETTIEEVKIETCTPEELAQHFKALQDSVDLIDKLVEAGEKSEDAVDAVKRNYEHIEIMLAKDYIVADSRDKSVFTSAVAAGKAFA